MAERGYSVLFEELQNFLECPLCYEQCQNPKMLPCYHWFCTDCLTQLIEKSDWPSKFFCPKCRIEVKRPPGGATDFPVAFFLNQLEDVVKRQKEKQHQNLQKCGQHGKPYEIYCETCSVKLCAHCMLKHDNNHEKITLEEFICKKNKLSLDDTMKLMGKQTKECEALINKIGTSKSFCTKRSETMKKEIQDHAEKVIKQVQTSVTKMNQEIDEVTQKQIQELGKMYTTVKTHMAKIDEGVQEIKELLKEKTTSIDIRPYKDLLEKLDTTQPVPHTILQLNFPDVTQKLLMGTSRFKYRKSCDMKVTLFYLN